MKAKICFVVAFSENRVIGEKNRLPWRLPDDLKHFRALTLGKTILMGRKTYEAIGRPLSERNMIVLTRNSHFHSDYAKVIHSLDTLFPLSDDLYVIGGAELYSQLLDRADLIYATLVKTQLEGDAFFPELDPETWKITARKTHESDAIDAYAYDFITYARVS